jgi:DNA polymerase-3 subunit chi
MTEIRFYHLQRSALGQALPGILGQAYKRGMRAIVRFGSDAALKSMDELLWSFKADSFLPHGTAATGHAGDQPIFLTTAEENPNQASLLVLADGATQDDLSGYDLCCDLFDGNDPEALQAARDRWKNLNESGAALKYFQQDESGRWEEKASTIKDS